MDGHLYIDICKAVVASIEKQLKIAPLKVQLVPVTTQTRFEAVASGKADLECGSSTVTLTRLKQVDFSFAKSFSIGQVKVNPKLDIFNALNSDDYTAVTTTQYGAATYMRPSTILQGRIVRLGVDVRW